MTNNSIAYYWQEFKHIEQKVLQTSRIVDFCDKHLKVYSAEFAETIFLLGSLNESLISELHTHYKFPLKQEDDSKEASFGCIVNGLADFWNLRDKAIYINSALFHFSDEYNTMRPFGNSDWYYNAYIDVKHKRGTGGLKSATLRAVLNALAVMFVLCVYARNQEFFLGSLESQETFDMSLGSDIFRVSCYDTHYFPYSRGGKYFDFERSVNHIYVGVYNKNAHQMLMGIYDAFRKEDSESKAKEIAEGLTVQLQKRFRVAHINNHEIEFQGDGAIPVPIVTRAELF